MALENPAQQGFVYKHRRGPLIQGLTQGPAFELEARIAAQRDSQDPEQITGAKRRRMNLTREHTANPGVQLRDLKDRATLRTADQQEEDREAKLQWKADLYDRLQNGETATGSADFLVAFQSLAQQVQREAEADGLADSSGPTGTQPPSFEPVHFRQQGTIQDEDDQVLRTGDAFKSVKMSAEALLEEVEKGPRQGRAGIGIENPHLRDEHEQRNDKLQEDREYIAEMYRKGLKGLPSNLGDDILEALEDLKERGKESGQASSQKVDRKVKASQPTKSTSALQRAKDAVLKRQALKAANSKPSS